MKHSVVEIYENIFYLDTLIKYTCFFIPDLGTNLVRNILKEQFVFEKVNGNDFMPEYSQLNLYQQFFEMYAFLQKCNLQRDDMQFKQTSVLGLRGEV